LRASKDGANASPQLASRRDRQRADDLLAAHHHHLVHHVDDHADVVRHDPHDIANVSSRKREKITARIAVVRMMEGSFWKFMRDSLPKFQARFGC